MMSCIGKFVTVALLFAPLLPPHSIASSVVKVTNVYDGDTVTLSDGSRVRLIQIDAPEIHGNECFSSEARAILARLLKSRTVTFVSDPKLDQIDRYGRKLGYLFVGKTNINVELVKVGAAAPYFYRGAKGQYAAALIKAVNSAQSKSIGLWKECPGTRLDLFSVVTRVPRSAIASNAECDPNYSGCVPLTGNDLDCTDLKALGLAPVKIVGTDIHRFDRDKDGYGCD